MARSRRRRSSCTTSTAGAAMAISSLVSGGCIVSGATISRSLLFTGVHVHSYSHDRRARSSCPTSGSAATCRLQQGRHRRRGAHSRRARRRRRPRARRQALPPHRKRRHADHPADDRQARRHERRLRVLSVASEVFPLIKTGGLADVVGALPGALAREGVEMRTLRARLSRRCWPARATPSRSTTIPSCSAAPARVLRGARRRARPVRARCAASLRSARQSVSRPRRPRLARQRASASRRWRASAPTSAKGASPASRPTSCTPTTGRRALAPAYLHYDGGARPGTVLTVHNLAFQGHFPAALLAALGLPPHAHDDRRRRIFRRRRLPQGRAAARRPHHHGLADLCARDHDARVRHGARRACCAAARRVVEGIVNGIDDEVWNPATDPTLAQNYSALRIDSARAIARRCRSGSA